MKESSSLATVDAEGCSSMHRERVVGALFARHRAGRARFFPRLRPVPSQPFASYAFPPSTPFSLFIRLRLRIGRRLLFLAIYIKQMLSLCKRRERFFSFAFFFGRSVLIRSGYIALSSRVEITRTITRSRLHFQGSFLLLLGWVRGV